MLTNIGILKYKLIFQNFFVLHARSQVNNMNPLNASFFEKPYVFN